MRFIGGFKRIPKGKRTALVICTAFVVLVLFAANIWAVLFVHLSFLRVILVNLFFLVVFSMPLYIGLTRGVEVYDQPSRKYLVRFIYFPLGVFFYTFVLLWFRVPLERRRKGSALDGLLLKSFIFR